MNEIVNKMCKFAKEIKGERRELAEKFSNSSKEERRLIKQRVSELDKIFVEVRDAINNLLNAIKEKKSSDEIQKYKQKVYDLATKYGVIIEDDLYKEEAHEEEINEEEAHEEEINEEKVCKGEVITTTEDKKVQNKQTLKNIIAGLGLVGATTGVLYGLQSCRVNNTEEVDYTQNEDKEDTKTESLSNKYNMTTKLIDASDERQVLARAQEIYDKFINISSMPDAAKKELSVERLANIIRMNNGEFALEDGNVKYNETIFDELGNAINAYHNSTSFKQFGTNLEFKPIAVFFEDDSLAHDIAEKSDELVSKIYDDIKANNVEKFQEDSVKWGEFLRDTVIYNDSTGKTVSLWTVNNEQKYPLLKSLTSVYGPSILEYSLGIDLAVRDSQTNTFGDTFGICIPFCSNEHNELTEIPLSKMIYDINETPMNSLAERAGQYEEWKENNESIMVQCGLTTQDWYNDKYNREIGYSKKLK